MRPRTTTSARGNAAVPSVPASTSAATPAGARRKSSLALTVAIAAIAAIAVPLTSATSASAAATPSPTVTATVHVERAVDKDAAFYMSAARVIKQSAAGKVDTSLLDLQLLNLENPSDLPEESVVALTRLVRTSSGEIVQAVSDYNAAAAAAAAQAAAEAAAAQAAAEAAAAALAAANTPDGARATARAMAASQYGWGDEQFSCLSSLWQKESSWNYQAYNSSGATGIPQALPGSKMASSGSDWATNATTQIAWGLGYISSVYGTPCSAWSHSQSVNWY